MFAVTVSVLNSAMMNRQIGDASRWTLGWSPVSWSSSSVEIGVPTGDASASFWLVARDASAFSEVGAELLPRTISEFDQVVQR